MNIVVNEDLKAYIDPLTPDEYEALERSLLTEGCRDALVLWGETLVDGHNRYSICQKHGLPFNTVQSDLFHNLDDVHLWMIDQHLGRRSVSDFQRGVLALRKRAIMAERRSQGLAATAQTSAAEPSGTDDEGAALAGGTAAAPASAATSPDPLKSRDDIAKAARLSSSQVVMIEKIQKQATPELVAAVKSGTISINAAAVVATLPEDEQRAAALAGKDELKQAAKRVRDAKRKPREAADADDPNAVAAPADSQVAALQKEVEQLRGENDRLRQQVAVLQQQLGL